MTRSFFSALLLSTAPAYAEAPSVVTDFAPIHSLVSQVMGKLGAPSLLLPQGADPHAFQMRPSQVRALTDAELVFWVGPELTPWLERPLENTSAAKTVALLDVPGTQLLESDHAHGEHEDNEASDDEHDEAGHEHEDEAGHEHEDEAERSTHEDHEDHEDHGHDPHAWLSPTNGMTWLTAIADELAAVDPENAETYKANAAKARLALSKSEHEITNILTPVRDKGFILFHDAYGYFTDHFELSSLGSVRESDSAPPSAARLAAIETLLASGQVHCVFAEAAEGQDMMRDLVEGTDIGFGILDPSGSHLKPGPNLYGQLLQSQADALHDCLKKTGN